MFLVVSISAIVGILVGASGCYLWREADIQRQLRQVLSVMETDRDREDISLPIASQLRRRAIASQQQQQNLEQQLFGWQSVLQEAPIGYVKLDAENQILWCNQMAQELLHIQKWEPGSARLLLELVRSYELDRSIQRVRSSQTSQSITWQFYYGYQEAAEARVSKGEAEPTIWLKASSIPLLDGAIGVFIEDRQVQIEAKTEQERWLTDLAHEIRTPLTAIRLVAETLQTKVTPDLNRWVDRMLQETNRLIDLVQNFLELSQLETSPTQYLKLAHVDIVELIEDAWHTLEPIASQKQIEFVYPDSQKISLEIDRARFIQVFINLFDNGIKYCPDRGQIRMEIRQLDRAKLGEWLEIDLYDDGVGFSPTDLPYIFDRLYRGDLSRHRHSIDKNTSNVAAGEKVISTTGSGLGLAIVRRIILAHGGTISASNHPDTGGAWLQIVLPNPA